MLSAKDFVNKDREALHDRVGKVSNYLNAILEENTDATSKSKLKIRITVNCIKEPHGTA